MAVLRIRVRFEGEEIMETERAWKLNPHDVEYMKMKLSTDKAVSETNLKKASGQLMYLRNLARLRTEKDKDTPPSEEDICPVSIYLLTLCLSDQICTELLGPHMVLFYCGHSLCVDCTVALMRRSKFTLKVTCCPSNTWSVLHVELE